jgi:hypothetical protein
MAPIPHKITIKDSDLTSVNLMTSERAKEIIELANKGMINGKTVKALNKTKTSIEVDVPDGLVHGQWIIVLTTDKDETVALLGYDSTTNKFLSQKEEDQIEPDVVNAPDIVKALDNVAGAIAKLSRKS